MGSFSFNRLQFCGEDDGHDDAVNRHHFTKDNGYQVLRSYSRCLDTTAEDRGAGDEDSPVPSLLVFAIQNMYSCAYHAAPTTDSPMQSEIPRSAHAYGDTLSKNCPTYQSVLLDTALAIL